MRDKCMAYYATCDSAKARVFRKELQQGVSRCLLKLASDGIKKDTIDIKQDTTTIKADTGSILLRLAGHVPRLSTMYRPCIDHVVYLSVI